MFPLKSIKSQSELVKGNARYEAINDSNHPCHKIVDFQKSELHFFQHPEPWNGNTNSTISFLGLWEQIHNPNFKPIEFDRFKAESGNNAFTLTPQQWIKATDAIGIISKVGRYGGTMEER